MDSSTERATIRYSSEQQPRFTITFARWKDTLDAFGVPFVAVDSGGGLEVSSEAEAMLSDLSHPEPLRSQATQLARHAATEGYAASGVGLPRLVREVPAVDGPLILRVHTVKEALGKHTGVVVLQPGVELQAPLTCDSSGLTARQLEVAVLIATGRATKEIAAALSISTHTARHHTEQVFSKLGVQTRAAVAAIVGTWSMGRSSHVPRMSAAQ